MRNLPGELHAGQCWLGFGILDHANSGIALVCFESKPAAMEHGPSVKAYSKLPVGR